jgi:hypothetical protein
MMDAALPTAVQWNARPLPLRSASTPIRFVMLTNPPPWLPWLPSSSPAPVERHVDVSGNVMLLSVDDDTMCQ